MYYRLLKNVKSVTKVVNNSMANYGRNLLGRSNSVREQEDVYERQQRNFNIISYYPKNVRPTLRNFPKLTLEDKLLEHGIGHNNKQ